MNATYWTFIIASIFLLAFIFWAVKTNYLKRRHPVFSNSWRAILEDKVSFYQTLTASDKARFEKEILYFINRITITGVEMEIDDTDRLLVASSAVIPLFGFPELRYRNISEVLLYKGTFNADNQTEGEARNILGKVGSGTMNRLMILSLPALHQGFENEKSKNNVGIHEFVHLIDKADGVTDGIPENLMQKQYVLPWLQLVHREIEKIKENESDINPYGATSEVEFLSVASEYFFNQPDLFAEKHPDLYELMTKMYRQEP
ncbi:M90 family metallopeptidase [Salmonirosea aquatica]|uniref:Peptidase n=1 Tax=Salmonirosea aquatica TaxID=2654236 RepID=A0A7C9FB18_9BACT|nr:peptidase [Cytophagaceae bacterium SJW1-29]